MAILHAKITLFYCHYRLQRFFLVMYSQFLLCYIEDHMGTFRERLLETSSGRNFAVWDGDEQKLKNEKD